MGYANAIVYSPVGIHDVQRALSVSSNDLGTLCTHININKWAKFKPVRVANVGRLSYSEVGNAKFGLVPALNTMLGTYGDGSGGTVVTSSTVLENILNANLDWTYDRPTGGTNSPYRLTDFYAPADNDGGYGYYHNTPQPMSGVSDWGLNLSDINACAGGSIPYTAGATTSAWKVGVNSSIAAPVYSRLSFRFGSSSYDNVGGMDVRAIPLNDLLGLMETAEYWRLAIAVQVPVNGAFQTMRFFSSRWSFLDAHEQSNSPSLVLPCLSTNQTLCQYISNYASYLMSVSGTDIIGNRQTSSASPTFRLPACLCLVKSMFLDRDGGTKNHCKIGGESLLYSTPSAMSRFEIIVTDDVNYSGTDAYKLAIISNVSTGNYAQMGEESWKRHEIRAAVLQQKEYAMPNTTLYYRVTYSYVAGYRGNTPVIITSTEGGEVTLATSGNTLVSKSLAAGPSLTIDSQTLSTSPLN